MSTYYILFDYEMADSENEFPIVMSESNIERKATKNIGKYMKIMITINRVSTTFAKHSIREKKYYDAIRAKLELI